MSPMLLIALGGGGLLILVAGAVLLFREPPNTRVEDRLNMLTGVGSPNAKDPAKKTTTLLAEALDATPDYLEKLLARYGNLSLLLEQADVSLSVTHLAMVAGLLGAVGVGVGIFMQWPVVTLPVCGLTLSVLPVFWILMRRKKRLRKIGMQLPDALEMLSRSLRAGQSLVSGFSLVASEVPAPLGAEFGRVFEEQNLGVPLDDSLHAMGERVPNLDIKFFATAVILQRQTGGDLAEILDKIGYLIRERIKIWGQIAALTGEGRLSGIVLLALPVALFLAVYRLNPGYISTLFTDPMGKKLLAGSIVLQVLGALMIRKIVNIEV